MKWESCVNGKYNISFEHGLLQIYVALNTTFYCNLG